MRGQSPVLCRGSWLGGHVWRLPELLSSVCGAERRQRAPGGELCVVAIAPILPESTSLCRAPVCAEYPAARDVPGAGGWEQAEAPARGGGRMRPGRPLEEAQVPATVWPGPLSWAPPLGSVLAAVPGSLIPASGAWRLSRADGRSFPGLARVSRPAVSTGGSWAEKGFRAARGVGGSQASRKTPLFSDSSTALSEKIRGLPKCPFTDEGVAK